MIASKNFQYIGKILDDIKSRIYGTAMGFVEETIILSELKTSCPYDRFSDELSSNMGQILFHMFVKEELRLEKYHLVLNGIKNGNPLLFLN